MTLASAPTAHTPHSPLHSPLHPYGSSRLSRPTPMPFSPSSRSSASVGQARTPLKPVDHRSPFHQDARTSSPNYFGLTVDPAKDYTSSEAGVHVRSNWSPPTSNVRSAAAASPRIVPLDQNPELDAFRRQSELNGLHRSSAFSMAPHAVSRSGSRSSIAAAASMPPPPSPTTKANPADPELPEQKQRSPKRLLSSPSPHVTDRPRRNSPAQFTDRDRELASQALPLFADERDSRLSLPPTNTSPSPPAQHQRAETLPAVLGTDVAGESKGGPTLVTPQHVVNLLEACNENILLLDLRVVTQYARSRITGALNLCIPTTLLKRRSYNLQKLAETFADEEQKRNFERWRSCQYIIVYDGNSSILKDALSCLNTLKKFVNEGWNGYQYVVRGGFVEFSKRFPDLIAHSSAPAPSPGSKSMTIESTVAPVVGGCPMPASTTKTAANPFFGNIRQNMDLIGGVGQMPVKLPSSMTQQQTSDLPQWLKQASDPTDHGKLVSDKFLQIEKRELKRMQEALSGQVHYGTLGSTGPSDAGGFRVAGIEKGAKNRYNNIWPYEHSRVRLEGVQEGGCDYVNANHLQASLSSKRYIATQGPIPATFTDFWKVVWQQDVRVIVMLTAEQEGGQIKAHNYWTERHYGPLRLTFLGEHRASIEPSRIQRHREGSRDKTRRNTNPSAEGRNPPLPSYAQYDVDSPSQEKPFVTVRKFTLSHADEPFERMREITQLQYANWPDFGAPAHPTHLLGLVEQCDAVVRSSYGGSPTNLAVDGPQRPILVHCSAGCGRTGTFCAVDSVIDIMKQRRKSNAPRPARQVTSHDVDVASPSKHFPRFAPPGAGFGFGSPRPQDSGFFMQEDANDSRLSRDNIDLIEQTVEEFRHQRLSAVQSLWQFVLCYESVLEWLAEQTPKTA